jgi:hypothetical protein
MKKQNLSLSISILALILSMIALTSSCSKRSSILKEKDPILREGIIPDTTNVADSSSVPDSINILVQPKKADIFYECYIVEQWESPDYPWDWEYVDGSPNKSVKQYFEDKYGRPDTIQKEIKVNSSILELTTFELENTLPLTGYKTDSAVFVSNKAYSMRKYEYRKVKKGQYKLKK